LLALALVVGVLWLIGAGAWSWSQDQYYVGEHEGTVVIYRGIDASLPGIDLSHVFESSNVTLDRLCDFDAGEVRDGISASSLDDARDTVDNLAAKMTDAGAGC
jgi:protein phosphatase